MTMHPLPPQAYTKDTLQKAYTWLLSQPTSIKELASSQDMLVSLYLKAQRNGDASLEAPSIQNFKQELKSLANMMGDFQTSQASGIGTAQNAQQAYQANTNYQNKASTSIAHQNSNQGLLDASGLDPQSLNAIHEVKSTFNLSSDTEALRALISLGYKHFKKINN